MNHGNLFGLELNWKVWTKNLRESLTILFVYLFLSGLALMVLRLELRKWEKTSFRKQKHVELLETILFFLQQIELGCVDGGSPQSFFLDYLQVHSNLLRWCVLSLYLLFSSFSGALLIARCCEKGFPRLTDNNPELLMFCSFLFRKGLIQTIMW